MSLAVAIPFALAVAVLCAALVSEGESVSWAGMFCIVLTATLFGAVLGVAVATTEGR